MSASISITTAAGPTTTPAPTTTSRRALWLPGLGFATGGAVAATVVAGAADALGVSLEIAGARIPLLGFTQLAFVFSVVGIVLAAAFRRWSDRPAQVFVRTAVALVAVSLVPDALTPDVDVATRVALMVTHIAVAAAVVPGLRSRLR
ncbi:DUF6069 family protein [Streptomyces sp. NBC_01506]|uniref:DUF6069 family protein n=1 Tax=Streptomyces sp. NBC_01506 TaxID=2903887 RepID=UPI00386989FD